MIGETRKRNKGNGAGLGVRGMLAILLSLSLLAVPLGSAGSVSAAEMGSRYAASASGVAAAERLGGSDRYATAVQISQAGWPGTSNAAILTAGADANLVDALTAAPLAYQLNAPILFTEGATLTPATETELKRLQVKTVYVANGSGVILDSVRDRLQRLGLTVKSLGGADRYATAVNIAKELENQGVAVNQVALTTGLSQADALSIAPVAAGKGMPILLTAPEQLPAVVQAYLAAKQAIVNKSYVIGGTGAVSETAAAALPGSVTRLGGTDRYATNRQVVQNFLGSFQNRLAYLANGQDGSMADALAGAPLAAKNGAPVLLTSGSADAVTQEFALKNLPSQVVALGGTGVVPGSVLSPLRAVQVLSREDATLGADDPAQPVTYEDNLVLSGAKMTLANATITHSLTVQGDQTKLSRIKVLGTLYLDPGANGSVNLSQVEAGRIVVLSGADHSIIFEDVISQLLQVVSSSLVHVVSQGVTQISNTMVSSNAILDAPSGNLGQVEVARSLGTAGTGITGGQGNGENPANPGAPGNAWNPAGEIVGLAAPSVELRGVFTQTIVVSTEATVKAATGASVAQLTVAPERSAQHISLQGTIQALNIDRQAEVALAANTQVKNTVVNAAAILDATAGSFGQVTLSVKIGSPNSNPNPNGTPTPGSGAATLQVVELRGNFTQTIAVSGQVQVKAAKEANVAKLQVAPEQSGQRVVLDGEFVNLEVNKEVKIELKDQAKVHEAVTNAKVDFEIPKGAEVGKLDPKGMGTTATGGGNVNGTATSEDTNAPPVVVTSPATNPPASGGGSSGGSSGGGSAVSVTPLTGADVRVTKGSIDFNYTFVVGTGTNVQRLSYADVLKAPYYLDSQASTVTLANSTFDLSQATPVKLSELFVFNNAGEGISEFQDLGAFTDKFPNFKPTTGAVEVGFPTQIKLHLVSKTQVNGQNVANPWSYDTDWINFASDDIKVFTLYGDVQALQGQMSQMIGDTVAADKATLELPAQLGGGLGSDPTSTVSWTSDNSAVSVPSTTSGTVYSATVTHGTADVNVTLTATITSGSLTETKDFPVTVTNNSVAPASTVYVEAGLASEDSTHFKTINAAVQAVADGGTIQVAAGTYPEMVKNYYTLTNPDTTTQTVFKSFTLQGPDWTGQSTPLVHIQPTLSAIDPNLNYGHVLQAEAEGSSHPATVNVTNLWLDGSQGIASGNTVSGFIRGITLGYDVNGSIMGNRVTGTGDGIYVLGAGSQTVPVSVTVSNNRVEQLAYDPSTVGSAVVVCAAQATVSDNTFTGLNGAPLNGIKLYYKLQTNISGNAFAGFGPASATANATYGGALVSGDAEPMGYALNLTNYITTDSALTITGNTFTDVQGILADDRASGNLNYVDFEAANTINGSWLAFGDKTRIHWLSDTLDPNQLNYVLQDSVLLAMSTPTLWLTPGTYSMTTVLVNPGKTVIFNSKTTPVPALPDVILNIQNTALPANIQAGLGITLNTALN